MATKLTTLDEMIASFSPERQKKIEDRSAQILAEEMSLQELRKAKGFTQVELARKLNIKQVGISRIEQRSDLMISTMRKHVKALGGTLVLVAEFKDGSTVKLSGLGDIDAIPAKRGKRTRATIVVPGKKRMKRVQAEATQLKRA